MHCNYTILLLGYYRLSVDLKTKLIWYSNDKIDQMVWMEIENQMPESVFSDFWNLGVCYSKSHYIFKSVPVWHLSYLWWFPPLPATAAKMETWIFPGLLPLGTGWELPEWPTACWSAWSTCPLTFVPPASSALKNVEKSIGFTILNTTVTCQIQ